jgi:acyl dehydratase
VPLDYQHLLHYRVPAVEQRYTWRDATLYALAVGLGADPTDAAQLRYVYEHEQQALPTMAAVLGYPGFWMRAPDVGVDWVRVVHGEQALRVHRPLPPEGHVVGRTRVTGIADKGPDKGAIVYSERRLEDAASGEAIATLQMSTFCRGDGGCGGNDPPPYTLRPTPERAPDLACELPTLPQAALLYRLNGDYNPLHADPEVARRAGFARPILHGLCTYAVAGHAVLRAVCGYDATRLRTLQARFSAPVYPGETLRTELWHADGGVAFRTRALERDVVVLSHGYAEVA